MDNHAKRQKVISTKEEVTSDTRGVVILFYRIISLKTIIVLMMIRKSGFPLLDQIYHRLLKASFQLLFVSIFSLHVLTNFSGVTVYNNTCVKV